MRGFIKLSLKLIDLCIDLGRGHVPNLRLIFRCFWRRIFTYRAQVFEDRSGGLSSCRRGGFAVFYYFGQCSYCHFLK